MGSWDRQVPRRCQLGTRSRVEDSRSVLSPRDLCHSSNTPEEFFLNSFGFVGKRDNKGFTQLFKNCFNRVLT